MRSTTAQNASWTIGNATSSAGVTARSRAARTSTTSVASSPATHTSGLPMAAITRTRSPSGRSEYQSGCRATSHSSHDERCSERK